MRALKPLMSCVAALVSLVVAAAAHAQITVGVVLSETGPAASLGIAQRHTIDLLPPTLAGQPVRYVVLDDQSSVPQAVANTRHLITEERVDVVLGSTITPNSLAMIEVVAEARTPMISWAASSRIVEPVDDQRRWVFKTPQNDQQMAMAIVSHMVERGIDTVGFIGFADAYGDSWWEQFSAIAQARGIDIVTHQRYNRTDTSVNGQTLHIMSKRPDAVLIAAAGTPAALPLKALKDRGFAGTLYQTHGAANNDFLRVCGRDCEGTFLPVGPVLVAAQLPDDHPVKASALAYVTTFEAVHGAGSVSAFGAHAWDSVLLLEAAVPVAVQQAEPGDAAFRVALRDALENVREVSGAHGIFTMSPGDHLGLDQRAAVMVEIQGGSWVLVP